MSECSVVTTRVQLHLGPASDECKALFPVSHFFVIYYFGEFLTKIGDKYDVKLEMY